MKRLDSIDARRVLPSAIQQEHEAAFDAGAARSPSASRRLGRVPPRMFSRVLWLAPLIGAIGLSCLIAQGCGGDTQSLAGNEPGSPTAGAGGTPPATGGEPMTPSGAGSGDITCEGPNPDATCFPVNTDPGCTTTNASTGAACTIDCRIECGFDGTGLKHCDCVSGRYDSCPCDRPATYQGAATAEFCTIGSGLEDELDETPCDTEWSQCVARDAVTGTPRGCACMKDDSGALQWSCGSTNNWFLLVSETGDGICEGATPDPTCDLVNPDASCSSSDARTGSICTQDCRVACGFQQAGLKICTCAGGVYSQCPCPRPDNYQGAPTAPPCQTSDGTTNELDDQLCTEEWQQCIGADPVTGNTPRGCVCMTNRLSGMLQWYCGSTNRWFAPE